MVWQELYLKFHPKILLCEEKSQKMGFSVEFLVLVGMLLTGLWCWVWKAS